MKESRGSDFDGALQRGKLRELETHPVLYFIERETEE